METKKQQVVYFGCKNIFVRCCKIKAANFFASLSLLGFMVYSASKVQWWVFVVNKSVNKFAFFI